MAPIVVLGNVCLADTGQLIAEYYYLYYSKSLAKLGELDLNTEIGFIAKPDLRTLGNEMNNDIAPLIAWPRNFKIIDGSTPLGKVPTDEKLLVGYILTCKKDRSNYSSLEQLYVDKYKEWEKDYKDELSIISPVSYFKGDPIQDSLDAKLEKYAAVKSETLSEEKSPRYVIIDRWTGEVLDDNDGLGYTTIEKAYNCYEYLLNSAEENYRRRRALSWLLNYADFDKKMLDIYLEIKNTGIWHGYRNFNKTLVEFLLSEYGYMDVDFQAQDLIKVWNKGLE